MFFCILICLLFTKHRLTLEQITLKARQLTQPQAPASLRSTVSFQARSGPAADFLEQTPWANPQHPIHQQLQLQQIQRQTSEQARIASNTLSTPAGPRRALDLSGPHGSASTITEPVSGPNSSAAGTPNHGDESHPYQSVSNRRIPSGPFGNKMPSGNYEYTTPAPARNGIRRPSNLTGNDPRSTPNPPPSAVNGLTRSPPPPQPRLGIFGSPKVQRVPSEGPADRRRSSPLSNAHSSGGGIMAAAGFGKLGAR